MKFVFVKFSFVFLLLVVSCSFFSSSTKKAENYFIYSPVKWKKIDSGESDIAFKLASGSIVTVSSLCDEITTLDLKLLTKHLLMGTRNVVYERQEQITIDKEAALFSSVTTTMKSKNIYLLIVVLIKNSCVFDFSIINSKKITKDEQTEFLNFVESFRYGKH